MASEKFEKKFDSGLRAYYRRKYLVEFTEKVAQLLDISITAVQIIESNRSDELRSLFETEQHERVTKAKPAFHRILPQEQHDVVERLLEKLYQRTSSQPVVLFLDPDSDTYGAVMVDSATILSKSCNIIGPIGNDLLGRCAS